MYFRSSFQALSIASIVVILGGTHAQSQPWKTYTDRIDLSGQTPKFGTIVVGTESAEIFGHMRKVQAPARAKSRNWILHTVEGPHALQEVSPSKEKVAQILMDIAKSLDWSLNC